MANNLSNHDGLIIIGVDEETDYSICDITSDPNRRKTQDIVVFLREKKFAGGIRPTVYVQSLSFRKSEIDVIVIRNDRNTPYYLTEQYATALDHALLLLQTPCDWVDSDQIDVLSL